VETVATSKRAGFAEVLLDGAHIEPAADLLRTGDGELLTSYRQETAALD